MHGIINFMHMTSLTITTQGDWRSSLLYMKPSIIVNSSLRNLKVAKGGNEGGLVPFLGHMGIFKGQLSQDDYIP